MDQFYVAGPPETINFFNEKNESHLRCEITFRYTLSVDPPSDVQCNISFQMTKDKQIKTHLFFLCF